MQNLLQFLIKKAAPPEAERLFIPLYRKVLSFFSKTFF